MAEHREHRYDVVCSWKGSTGAGYEQYSRAHDVSAPPAQTSLALSSDPAFRGDPARLNPEQLLVMAAASCQMLSFLAIAARKRIDVVDYQDRAEGLMPEDDKPVRITRILLKPRILVKGEVDQEAVKKMVELAHHQCFIANTLKSDIQIQPQIVIQKA